MSRRRKWFAGCLVVIVGSILLLCGINTAVFWVIPTIQQSRWEARKPQQYSFTVQYGTFVTGIGSTFHETVANGIQHREGDPPVLDQPTIEHLFDEAKAWVMMPFGFLFYSVDYDPTYGFPTHIEAADFDFGKVTTISDFTPQ